MLTASSSLQRPLMLDPRHILDVKKQQIDVSLNELFEDVISAIRAAASCLSTRKLDTCQDIIANDVNINNKRRLIEQDCLVAIASQQPVAHDLRDIVAYMRMAGELERIGDYASDIARSVLELTDDPLQPLGLDEVMAMTALCLQMLDGVRQANAAGDAAQARTAAGLDDELDSRLRNLVSSTLDAMRTDARLVDNGSRILWIAHNLERCGDRTTNIAEQVIYRLEGVVEELD